MDEVSNCTCGRYFYVVCQIVAADPSLETGSRDRQHVDQVGHTGDEPVKHPKFGLHMPCAAWPMRFSHDATRYFL